jgi:hypothetical protein
MNIYTFDKLTIGTDGFYDLFAKTVVANANIVDKVFVVTDEYAGRIDLVSKYLYGSDDFTEELMTLNNIMNPWSIKQGDLLLYSSNDTNYQLMYKTDPDAQLDKKDTILMMNNNKVTKKDANRIGYPPTIKPDNLKQIDINYNKKKITIINKFK